MSKRWYLVVVLALVLCLAFGAAPALAVPSGNGNGNAYAYAYAYGHEKRDVVVPPPPPPPPVIQSEPWQPFPAAPSFIIPLQYEVMTGYLGYCVSAGGGHRLADDGSGSAGVQYCMYFAADPAAPVELWSWAWAPNRIVYLYSGYSVVSYGGVDYPVLSGEAAAILADPTIRWECTYRQMGYSSFQGWVVSRLSPAP